MRSMYSAPPKLRLQWLLEIMGIFKMTKWIAYMIPFYSVLARLASNSPLEKSQLLYRAPHVVSCPLVCMSSL
jgi:hypothetical protein